MVFTPGSLIQFYLLLNSKTRKNDENEWRPLATKNCSKGSTVTLAARFCLEWTWIVAKPSGVAGAFSVEADSNNWSSNLEAKTTVHVWKWRIHHRSVVIVMIKHRISAVNKSLQARHNHVQGLQQTLTKSSLLHCHSEICSLTERKDKSVISVSRWTDIIWLVIRMTMAMTTQNLKFNQPTIWSCLVLQSIPILHGLGVILNSYHQKSITVIYSMNWYEMISQQHIVNWYHERSWYQNFFLLTNNYKNTSISAIPAILRLSDLEPET